jgi:hypothetical protein
MGWLNGAPRTVVTVDTVSMPEEELQARVVRLERRVERLRAIIWLLAATIRAFGLDLAQRRLPEGQAKAILLRTIERARQCLPLKSALRIVRLSASRSCPACEVPDDSVAA